MIPFVIGAGCFAAGAVFMACVAIHLYSKTRAEFAAFLRDAVKWSAGRHDRLAHDVERFAAILEKP